MTESDKLSPSEISEVVTSGKEEVESILEEKDYSPDQLKKLIDAEKSGRNRSNVLNLLRDRKKKLTIQNELGIAESEVIKLQQLINRVEKQEGLEIEDETEKDFEELDQDRVIELMSMTVKELRSHLSDNSYRLKDLKQILGAEKAVKDRKTAKKLIKQKIDKRKLEEDTGKVEEDLEGLEKDLKELEEDEVIQKKQDGEYGLEKDSGSEKGEEDKEETGDTEAEDEDSDTDEESSESEDEELEEKKEVAEELDQDIGEERLKALSLEDLKEIRDEKERREELVSNLLDEGLDRERLENASTRDLKKLWSQVSEDRGGESQNTVDEGKNDEERSEGDEEKESGEDGKSEEEMREEAEEDLQQLMGAGKASSSGKDAPKDRKEKAHERIKNLKSSIAGNIPKLSEEEDDEGGEFLKGEEVREKIDNYRDLGKREASVKTAQILKAYLEYKLEVERELTYGELSDRLENEDIDGVDRVAEFFDSMQKAEYKQEVEFNAMDDVIDASEKVIESLER
ncbi:MAG: hypothetical protein ABEJ93_01920 [Candidatus Nanohalobium sp.]